MSFVSDLDTPLLRLGPQDVFTLRDACQGVHVFGGIGSGKTSGSGKMLAGAYLRAGMGGLVTAVKPDEVPLWRAYAKQHGRRRSLVLFDEREGFNFLSYELARQGMEGVGTATECLLRVLEAADRSSGDTQKGQAFWEQTKRQLLRYAIAPLYAAQGVVSVTDIIRFLTSAPTTDKQAADPAYRETSFMYQTMQQADQSPRVAMPPDLHRGCVDFWANQYAAIPEKTRGNILISITTVLDRFTHGRLARAFCGRTTILPEMTFHGAVIVLAMPTLTWNEDGVIAQTLFKYMFQRAVLSRNALAPKHRERPVFLWSDEAQETVTSYDGEFLSLCRASKACTVYLTQSLPTYNAKMGGTTPQDATKALVGKFMTNIFHANACPDTNKYASEMIGRVLTIRGNFSSGDSHSVTVGMSFGQSESQNSSSNYGASGSSGNGGHSSGSNSSHGSGNSSGTNSGSNRGKGYGRSTTRGRTETMDNDIEAGDFGRVLLTGGPANRNIVTAVWFQGGRNFRKSGTNWLLQRFRQ